MASADIAIARCRRTKDAGPADLYPDDDAEPLATALNELGASSVSVAWDDQLVEWAAFDRVVISSTWDSADRPAEYLVWARRVSAVSKLFNPSPVLEWGLDKSYLRELADQGIPVIPTTWVEPLDSWQPPEFEFVVKPAISAGGRKTARYLGRDVESIGHVRAIQATGQTVMVQPYRSAVDDEGEIDLVFIDGEFSHAVRKDSLLHLGEGVVEKLWTRLAWSGATEPSGEQLSVADKTIALSRSAV